MTHPLRRRIRAPLRPARLLALGLCSASLLATCTEAEYTNFNNGAVTEHQLWLDTAGKIINAHDGGIIHAEGRYHWYGMALQPLPVLAGTNGGQKTMTGVSMYGSTDLYNWTNEGVILPCSSDPASPLCGPMRFERPKIIYHDATKRYVMWFHYVARPGDHGNRPGCGEAGIAWSGSVTGPYAFRGCTRPVGNNGIVRDCTLFKDDDGSAYLVYDRDVRPEGGDLGRALHVVKLSGDYLSCTATFCKIPNAAGREAPVMLKRNGVYFLITSGMTGWEFNRANYYTATNILGPYTWRGDPCVGNHAATTFNSQGTQAFAVEGERDAFIFMAERHNTKCMTDSSFIFLPVIFTSETTLELRYIPSWTWKWTRER